MLWKIIQKNLFGVNVKVNQKFFLTCSIFLTMPICELFTRLVFFNKTKARKYVMRASMISWRHTLCDFSRQLNSNLYKCYHDGKILLLAGHGSFAK